MTNDLKRLFDVKESAIKVQIGNGNKTKTTAVGKYRERIIEED
jgi:hypothetical protein